MKTLTTAIFILFTNFAFSQSSETAGVEATINQLFKAMQKGDSAMAAEIFDSSARLQTTYFKDGKAILEGEPISGFLHQIASKPANDSYDERISNIEVRIDANLAAAWTPYQFYFNGKFSHCGVNAFQLVKLNDKWKIIQITDTRRRKCE